jgi:hypothetical protein
MPHALSIPIGVAALALSFQPLLPESDSVSRPSRFPEIHLLNAAVVRSDLKLDKHVETELDDLHREFAETIRREWDAPKPESGPESGQPAHVVFTRKVRQLRAEYSARSIELLNAVQQKRVKQIQWQFQSVGRYCDPEFADLIELSDQQRREIAGIIGHYRQDVGLLVEQSVQKTRTPQQLKERLRRSEESAFEGIAVILTPEQRELATGLLQPPILFKLRDIPTAVTLRRVATPAR